MDVRSARTVLAVQPHYDDNDIGCAGTLRLLRLAGASITYVTVTDDLAGVLDSQISDDEALGRIRAEQVEAGAVIGVSAQVRLDWPDAAGLDRIALRDQVVDLIRQVRPDLVVTVDPWLRHESHSDHLHTGMAVAEAMVLSGLPRFRRHVGLDPHQPAGVAFAMTTEPTDVVDTSSVQEERHAVLDCYRSQFTSDELRRLHRGLDTLERSVAPTGGTHGERLRVLAPHQLHVGLTG
jgi:LmbE family N-acetylglucosaminyl deacetylase